VSAHPVGMAGPRVELAEMTPAWLDAVMAIEQAVYEFPWTRGNFADAMQAGYPCRVVPSAAVSPASTAPGGTGPGGALCAYAVLMSVLDEVHLLNLAVAPHWQGRGIGRACLDAVLDLARSGGARTMTLEVRPSNEVARRLYHQEGFVEVGRRRGYYPARSGREDALLLTRELS
jgi:ribosomal-protein-alanine N-acetyltransferase